MCKPDFQSADNGQFCVMKNCGENTGNTCDSCASTFTFTKNKLYCVTASRYSNCEDIPDLKDSEHGKCRLCAANTAMVKETSPNVKHSCEAQDIAQCTGYQYGQTVGWEPLTHQVCTGCNTGYELKRQDSVCDLIPIPGCGSQNLLECTQCASGFARSQDKKKCTDGLGECLETDNAGTHCTKCASGFAITKVDGTVRCQTPSVTRCAEVASQNHDEAYQKCTKCEDTYYLTANHRSCLSGSVTNCLQYQQGEKNRCSQC